MRVRLNLTDQVGSGRVSLPGAARENVEMLSPDPTRPDPARL